METSLTNGLTPQQVGLVPSPVTPVPCLEELLEASGFTKASKKLLETQTRARKLHIAYHNYQWIRKESIAEFNAKLKKNTLRMGGSKDSFYQRFDELVFTNVEEYEKVPPMSVLEELITARRLGCFDSFEVAHIASQRVVKDPIVFGRIAGCTDRFFIAQWDDDVKFEDLVKLEQFGVADGTTRRLD